MLSDKEKKRRQHEKELKSLRNKMGKSIVWFDALNKTQQYDILFAWKREKHINTRTKPQKKVIVKKFGGYANGRYQIVKKEIEIISYPPKLKYFIKDVRPNFSVSVTKMRESQLKHLLN